MGLQFTDSNGRQGTITDSLEVDYEGAWEAGVKEFVLKIGKEVSDEERDFQMPDAMSHIVLKLPVVTPIVEIERERA